VLFVTEMEHIFHTEINKMYHITGIYRRLVYRMDTEISTLLPVCVEAVPRLKRLFVVMHCMQHANFFPRFDKTVNW